MDADSWLSWFAIFALLCFAAYFAICEVSTTSVSRIRLKARLDRGDIKAEKALYVQEHFDNAISAILIGTNIVHITTATLVTLLVTNTWGPSWVGLGTICCTILVFFAGEMLPKSIGKRYSEKCAIAVAPSLCFFMAIFGPASKALSAIGAFFSKLFKGDPEVTVTEDELAEIIENMTYEGEIDEDRGELISSALEFADIPVEHVLTPRVDVASLEVHSTGEQVLEFLRKTKNHSRIPVYDGSIDNVVGILQVRKYIREYIRSGKTPELRKLLDKPCFVHSSTNVKDLLEQLSRQKMSMAIVTDSYGGTAGIVTTEDILEELVGEIYDEDDLAEEKFKALDSDKYEVSAEMEMTDLLEALEYTDPEDTDWDRKSLGEFAYEQFDRIPVKGNSFRWQRLNITVQSIRKHRILKLLVQVLPAEEVQA